MRGKPFFNFEAFDRAAKQLRTQGHTVISPADLDRAVGFDALTHPHPGCKIGDLPLNVLQENRCSPEECMDRDLAAVKRCDGLVLLDGWDRSTGAVWEVATAKFLSKRLFVFIDRSQLEDVTEDIRL